MNRSQLTRQAKDLVESVRMTRSAFTRENLGDVELLGMQVMLILFAEDGLSLKECAERLAVGPTNVSKAVSRLEAAHLVDRTAADHRTNALALTQTGRARTERFLRDAQT